MATSTLRKRAWTYGGLVGAVLLLLLLAVAAPTWWLSHQESASPGLGSAVVGDQQTPLGLTVLPLVDSAEPSTQEALSVQSSVEAMTSTVPPLSQVVTPSQAGGSGFPALLLGSVLASLGILALVAVMIIRSRRPRMAWLGAALMVMLLVAGLATPVFAGAGTHTRWTVPHTFSDNAWGLAKDPTSGAIYVAEHMVAAPASDAGRIAQLNPTTNDFVEWPTANSIGTSMAVVGGNVFFTEPTANILGKLEPTLNKFTRWQLPTAGGDALIFWVDGSSNVWYFSLSAAKIGRVNPATNDFTEWVLAPAGTPIRFFGRDAATGYMWFSIPGEAKIGRLDLASNQITQWTLPTERVSVIAVKGNTVWFSGAKDPMSSDPSNNLYFTIHVGRLDVASNQVTRWTVVPTDTPGIGAWQVMEWEDSYGYTPVEIPVSTGLYRPRAVVDSTGKPWFLMFATTGNWLVRLDPDQNQLLEFNDYATTLVGIDTNDVILGLHRAWWLSDLTEAVVYFDTRTSSETRFSFPCMCGWTGGYTGGFLRLSDTDFWFTRPGNAGISSPAAKVEHLVIVP